VGLGAGQDGRGKSHPTGIRFPDSPARVAVPTTLPCEKYKPVMPRPLNVPMDIRVGLLQERNKNDSY
jgi:hypothetical protein